MDLSNFTSVGGNSVNWEPKQKGSTKEKNLEALKSGKTSYIVGYYLETMHDQGKDGNSMIHKIKLVKVGDVKHLSGEAEEGDTVSIWGTGVLNDRMIKNVTPGECILIKWEGKVKSKAGREYHSWDIMKDPNAEVISVGEQFSKPEGSPEPAVTATEASGNSEEDDLPF
jgi:hypothetical protein